MTKYLGSKIHFDKLNFQTISCENAYGSLEQQVTLSLLILINIVIEQLGDQINMGQEHSSAAIPIEAEIIKNLGFGGALHLVICCCGWVLVLLALVAHVDEFVEFVSDNLTNEKEEN